MNLSAQLFSARDFTCYVLSERALTLDFGTTIHPETSRRITGFYHLLNINPFPGLLSSVPAYTSLTVFYDPVMVLDSLEMKGRTPQERVIRYLEALQTGTVAADPGQATVTGPGTVPEDAGSTESRTVRIPVFYGGEYGPDLGDVASVCGLSPQEVIRIHSGQVYEVSMIGFMPGFTYLSGLPDGLACPRKQIPQQTVPAGSVGIAGAQTGIYSLDTPGGWQIIGRISLKLFDPERMPPVLLKIGDRVQFIDTKPPLNMELTLNTEPPVQMD